MLCNISFLRGKVFINWCSILTGGWGNDGEVSKDLVVMVKSVKGEKQSVWEIVKNGSSYDNNNVDDKIKLILYISTMNLKNFWTTSRLLSRLVQRNFLKAPVPFIGDTLELAHHNFNMAQSLSVTTPTPLPFTPQVFYTYAENLAVQVCE